MESAVTDPAPDFPPIPDDCWDRYAIEAAKRANIQALRRFYVGTAIKFHGDGEWVVSLTPHFATWMRAESEIPAARERASESGFALAGVGVLSAVFFFNLENEADKARYEAFLAEAEGGHETAPGVQ